jgi:hypothetical protein
MANAINTFEKGMQTDATKINQPKGSYRDALNAVNFSDEGDMYALTNERGAALIDIIPAGFQVVGRVNLNKEIILFLTNADESLFKLGLMDKNNNYVEIFEGNNNPDYENADTDQFGFTITKPIDCVARQLINGDRLTYFTDDNQPFGLFNLDDILENGAPLPAISKIVPDINNIKTEFLGVTDGAGILNAGSYQILPRYVTKDGTPVNYSIISNIIPIVNEGKGVSWSSYDGASQDTQTSKSIRLRFTNVDQQFQYIEVTAVRFEGVTSTTEAYVVDRIPITSDTLDYTLSSIPQDAEPITAEELRINSITYDRAKTITQKDNRLFLGNLRETTALFNQELQFIANRMTVGYRVTDYKHKANDNEDNEFSDYKNEKFVHDKRTYRRGETYSFALGVVFKDGSESFAYHIPANDHTTAGNDVTATKIPAVNLGGGTGTLGTYISTNTYPLASAPEDPLYPGTTPTFTDVAAGYVDNHIRHHLMPTLQQHAHFNNNGGLGVGGDEFISLLSLDFTFNEAFSEELLEEIQDVRIYRERRSTPENRSMLAQGIATGMVATHQRYRDKSWRPQNDDYKGEAIDVSEVYKKAPVFGGVELQNHVYENDNPGSNFDAAKGAGFTFTPIENAAAPGNKSYQVSNVKQMCFHSPETQLAEGVFLNQAELGGCSVQDEMSLKGPSTIQFFEAPIVGNRPAAPIRSGYETFNAFTWYTDFQGWEAVVPTTKKIRFTQSIEHGEVVKIKSDDPEITDLNFVNTYSTGFQYIDIYSDETPTETINISPDVGIRVEMNEGKNNRGFNLTDGVPSEILGINTQGGVYKTKLINITKETLQNQYGQITASEYISVDTVFDEGDVLADLSAPGFVSKEMHGGDTYITKFAITNKQVWRRVLPFENGFTSTFYNGKTAAAGQVVTDNDDNGDYFMDAGSPIDDIITRKGDEYHSLGYFFVESNIHSEFRHEIVNQETNDSIPFFPRKGFTDILEAPPENDDSRGYNVQYSFENASRSIFTPTIFTETISRWGGRLIYSDRSEEDDVADSYRIFSQFNKYDLQKDTGDIWNIFVHNNILYSHTPKSLWTNYVNAITQQSTDLGQVILGTGGLFNPPSRQMFTSNGGFGGCISQWGGVHTPFGYLFPDVLQGKVFMLGQSLEEVGLQGMGQFFDNNLSEDLKEDYIDNPFDPNSAGILGVWDSELKRAILTKRGTSKDFSISYSPIAKAWISKHSYLPNVYAERDNEFFAITNGATAQVHQHNRGNHGNFYGSLYPFKITAILSEGATMEKSFDNVNVHSTCYDSVTGFEEFETFKQMIAENDYQSSGLITINTTNDFNPTLANDEILGRWKKNHFQVAVPRDGQNQLEEVVDQWKNSSRMKSKFLSIELIYPNSVLDSKKLTVNFIEYIFRLIAR